MTLFHSTQHSHRDSLSQPRKPPLTHSNGRTMTTTTTTIISLKTLTLSLFLITTLTFFLIFPNHQTPKHNPPNHRSLLTNPTTINGGIINYRKYPFPALLLTLVIHFYLLIKTAQDHFSPLVTKLCSPHYLNLTPSMGGVTVLALGNGAPDVFSTSAAVSLGDPRAGFGSVLSAGAFVSGLVVGLVGVYAGPFGVDPGSFVRDVGFYLVAGLGLFYVYLSGELFFWQAVGLVVFYGVFVGFVFWMDFGNGNGNGKSFDFDACSNSKGIVMVESGKEDGDPGSKVGFFAAFRKISKIWEVPVSILLKLTIPQTESSEWSRFYQSANIALCPLAFLYSCKSFMPMNHPVSFLIPQIPLPLWFVVLFSSSSLAILYYILEKEPPKTEQMPVVLVAFVMSVFWISNIAGELLNCLATLGTLLNLPPAILGLTVLAWGNSMGDLVADVAVAKAGQPALAMAGCFAGPMFNMLVGLGTALVIQTAKVYPEPYVLHFHVSIVVAFVFLFLSLMGSLLVVTWSRFRVPRFWGFCLVGLYVVFIVVSLLIARFST